MIPMTGVYPIENDEPYGGGRTGLVTRTTRHLEASRAPGFLDGKICYVVATCGIDGYVVLPGCKPVSRLIVITDQVSYNKC